MIINNRDFNYLSKTIEKLDLVVTADNTVAHLAGALGIRTWCLLPFCPEWRWGVSGESAIWYQSLQLFRQTERKTQTGSQQFRRSGVCKFR